MVTSTTLPFRTPQLAAEFSPDELAAREAVIEAADARYARSELTALLAQLSPDSVASLVVRRARQELASLAASAPGAGAGDATVVGPIRITHAA